MKHHANLIQADTDRLGRAFKTLASMRRTESGKPIMYPNHIEHAIQAACCAVQDVLKISNEGAKQ